MPSSEGGQVRPESHEVREKGGCLLRGSFRLKDIQGEEPSIASTVLFDKAHRLYQVTNPLPALMMRIKDACCDGKDACWFQGLEDLSERCLPIGHFTKDCREDRSVEVFRWELALSSPVRSERRFLMPSASLRCSACWILPAFLSIPVLVTLVISSALRTGNALSAATSSCHYAGRHSTIHA